jgi:putative toxin-antitoxin system antitoxin component (TIGR02293 family)
MTVPISRPKARKAASARQPRKSKAANPPRVRSGVKPFQIIQGLAADFGLSAKDIAGVLDITPKTFSRWKGRENFLSEQQADRMLILKSIVDLGRKVLGSDANVKKWIREPVFSLDGQIPLNLLKTESGRRQIESALHQIEYGFF